MRVLAHIDCAEVYIPYTDYMPAVIEYQDDMEMVYRKVEEMAAIVRLSRL